MRTIAEAGRVLGTLEERVMASVWNASAPVSVREVVDRLGRPRLAYTTILTTMDRLYKKGLLSRERDGIAFVYRAAMSRDDLHGRIIEETVSSLLAKGRDPVLAAFVDVAASVDEANLARLERLIAAKRRGRR